MLDREVLQVSTLQEEQMRDVLARQPKHVTEILRHSTVGVAGVGGRGSVVAENLARAGVGKLVLVDCDTIEASNLNRQRYSLEHIGLPKVKQMEINIASYAPWVTVDAIVARLDSKNSALTFSGCDVIVECFDDPEAKASLMQSIRGHLPDALFVGASGVAGLGSWSTLSVRHVSNHCMIVGDHCSEAAPETGLFAARVGVIASLQALITLQYLVGETV
jgi:sulfur carrier protein ThiS adenylyltransferase